MKMKIYRSITFHISYKYSTYQIIKNPCNENNVNITYQVMGRQQITQNMIHENLSRKYIQVHIDYLIE